jgi:hypothetical protein
MTSTGGFVFRHPDDETLEIVMIRGGEEFYIASANHDEHGWSGMTAVENAVREVANILGMPIRETS